MRYKKPICECGSILLATEEYIYKDIYKINADGRLSKRKLDVHPSGTYNGLIFLECVNKKCGNQYRADIDSKGRLLRDEQYL